MDLTVNCDPEARAFNATIDLALWMKIMLASVLSALATFIILSRARLNW